MPNKPPRMKLSPEEEAFLRHWVYDEAHYREGQGPAKRLQLEHHVRPADLAVLLAAGMPDPTEQQAAGEGPPPAGPPAWPWSDDTFRARLNQARGLLNLSPAGSQAATPG